MNRFFITGGFGYIGLCFAIRALKNGDAVHLYDNICYEQNYETWVDDLKIFGNKFTYSIGDTRNHEYIRSEIARFKPTHIMHWGDLSSVYACNHNPTYTKSVCGDATKNIIDLSVEFDTFLFYNSSSSVYGAQKIKRLEPEDSILPEPTDLYCKYKLEVEEYIKQKKLEHPSSRIIVFRPATVFGVAPRFRIELLPNHFFYMGYNSGLIKVADLNAYRSSIDVFDLVNGYFHVIEKDCNEHLIYNIGNQNMTKLEYSVAVQRHVECKIITISDVGDLRNLQIESTRFESEFSFKPKLSLDESFERIKLFFDSNLEEIKNNNFSGFLNMPLEKWRLISE
jgi:nucleoside-diphosphate-sugar epimerase